MVNKNKVTPMHVAVKLHNTIDKGMILKAARQKRQIKCKGLITRLTADFSTEATRVRRQWNKI